MFTGLVQTKGVIATVSDDGHGGKQLRVRSEIAANCVLGESIAVNGVCLTAAESDRESIEFQLGPETIARSTFARIGSGDGVNLERALRVGDAIGGHFVSGHVDCVGMIEKLASNGEWRNVTFSVPREYDDLLTTKGSIAVDGISLTITDVEPGRFGVMLIPHTLAATTLGGKKEGDAVNIEFDMLAKHVVKLVKGMTITGLKP